MSLTSYREEHPVNAGGNFLPDINNSDKAKGPIGPGKDFLVRRHIPFTLTKWRPGPTTFGESFAYDIRIQNEAFNEYQKKYDLVQEYSLIMNASKDNTDTHNDVLVPEYIGTDKLLCLQQTGKTYHFADYEE